MNRAGMRETRIYDDSSGLPIYCADRTLAIGSIRELSNAMSIDVTGNDSPPCDIAALRVRAERNATTCDSGRASSAIVGIYPTLETSAETIVLFALMGLAIAEQRNAPRACSKVDDAILCREIYPNISHAICCRYEINLIARAHARISRYFNPETLLYFTRLWERKVPVIIKYTSVHKGINFCSGLSGISRRLTLLLFSLIFFKTARRLVPANKISSLPVCTR
jgi:hypothetical protein